MLAERLLVHQIEDSAKLNAIIEFLCSDSGSHDYTISRREASKKLGLNIQIPSNEQYQIIKDLYNDFSSELGLGQVFDQKQTRGAFTVRRAFIESNIGGSDYFVTEARVVPFAAQDGQQTSRIEKTFEGWRHEHEITITNQQSENVGGMIHYEATNEFGL